MVLGWYSDHPLAGAVVVGWCGDNPLDGAMELGWCNSHSLLGLWCSVGAAATPCCVPANSTLTLVCPFSDLPG